MTNKDDKLNEMWQRLNERYCKSSRLTNVRMKCFKTTCVLDKRFIGITSTL